MKNNSLIQAGIFIGTLCLFSGNTLATHHEEAEPQQQAVAQLLTFCSLNDGKTIQDAQALGPMWGRFFKKHDMQQLAVQATPMFRTGEGSDFFFMNFLPFAAINNFYGTIQSEGQKELAATMEVATCSRALHNFRRLYYSPTMGGNEVAYMHLSACTRNDGVEWTGIMEQAQGMAARLQEGEFKGLLGISFPQYGSRMEAEFVRFLVMQDMTVLGQVADYYANQRGWEQSEKYNQTYAQCSRPSIWAGTTINRPQGN